MPHCLGWTGWRRKLFPRKILEDTRAHLRIARRREEDAYFFRRHGYTMIARNFRSPQHRGELDIVASDQDVLCFIEVKTRTKPVLKPAEAAVDRDKQSDCWLPATSRARYLRRASGDST